MARSSKPKPRYELVLTAGGGADLVHVATGRCTWSANTDPEFRAHHPGFLEYDDTSAILDWLEDIGELSTFDADHCAISEESLEETYLAGLFGVPTQPGD